MLYKGLSNADGKAYMHGLAGEAWENCPSCQCLAFAG